MTTDLRSDTVTKPTPAMLQAMMSAPVGDDVYGEDPTINELQRVSADMFGMEAALFCPSGTMTNQIAIKVHTQPGDELICAAQAHVYKYEGGGIASNSGVQAKVLPGDRGRISAAQIREAINSDDVHFPVTKLVCIENTSNRGGGSVYSLEAMRDMRKLCDEMGLAYHLDGARVFNALVAEGYSAKEVGRQFHSISICLSKSLGCPVGSLLLGTNAFIAKAKRVRKVFGGGMRQAGFLAAAGLYALNNHVDRLKEDHARAKYIASLLASHPAVKEVMPVETNIIIFALKDEAAATRMHEDLKSKGVLTGRISPTELRMVFHLDITDEMTERLAGMLTGTASR